MTVAEKNIVETIFSLYNKLNFNVKSEVRKKLVENDGYINEPTVEKKLTEKEKLFYSSFGGWESDLSPEEEVAQIRAARRFRDKNISLD